MPAVGLQERTIFDDAQIQCYYQPQAGIVERFIDVSPLCVEEWYIPPQEIINSYEIHEFGTGCAAVDRLIPIIFERQFKKIPDSTKTVWHTTVLCKVRCALRSRSTNERFSEIKPAFFSDIAPAFNKHESEERKADVLYYVDRIRNGEGVECPLYITGNVLNQRGAATDPKALYMIDGARRITAHALTHAESISVFILMSEEEFGCLVHKEIQSDIKEQIKNITWFNNYHSLPLVGIKGQRTLRRYDLMDMECLRGSSVIDFGCNIGQASIKAVQAGARKVLGLDVMDDTLTVASEIKDMLDLDLLEYKHVDFNAADFDIQIDKYFPDKADYSFFFSVYRTKELTQRERLFRYVIDKTAKGIFFEGHAHPKIDSIEYYEWLFDCFNVAYTFLGFSEGTIRPLFYIDLEHK